ARQLRRRPGPAEGQDRAHRPPGVGGRVRRGDRSRGVRDGAPPLRGARRARPGRGCRRGGPRRGPAAPMTASTAARVVLLADPLTLEDGVFAELRRVFPDVDFQDARTLAPPALAARLADGVDGLIVRSRTKVKAELLERAGPRLRVIGRAGIG